MNIKKVVNMLHEGMKEYIEKSILLTIYQRITEYCGSCMDGCPGCKYWENVREPVTNLIIKYYNLDDEKDVIRQIEELIKELENGKEKSPEFQQ